MENTSVKPHWSFWLICIIALVWNSMGCMNFITQMDPEMHIHFPEAVKSLIETRPEWATAAFALAVFSGVVGDVLLMLRKSIAIYLFMASLLGVVVTNIHTAQVSSDTGIWIGSLMSLMLSGFMVWYSKLVKQKDWIA